MCRTILKIYLVAACLAGIVLCCMTCAPTKTVRASNTTTPIALTLPGYPAAVFVFEGRVLGPPVYPHIEDQGLMVNDVVVIARADAESLTVPGVYPTTDTRLKNSYDEFDVALRRGGVVFYGMGKPVFLIPPGRQTRLALQIVKRYQDNRDASDLESQGMESLRFFKDGIRLAAKRHRN